jgi:toxin FitB
VILLDTNVVSELMRRQPDPRVIQWLDRQPRTSIWVTSITVLEIRFGMAVMDSGKRRDSLIADFDRLLISVLEQRIAPFAAEAAQEAAALMAERQKRATPGDLRDSMIAGIALASRATLATRNTRHFEDAGFPVVNPWEA